MAGFYGRGGLSSSVQAPYGRGTATGYAPQPQPQPQPQPAVPPPSSAQPSVPSERHPSPPQSQPTSPQVQRSIPVASTFKMLFEQGHFLPLYTVTCNIDGRVLLNITGSSRADVQNESIRRGQHS